MTILHKDPPFAEPNDDDELGLTPLPEDDRELAPDEPFRPNMILVPVLCGTCGLRMYAQEKYVGKWIACPDCGALSEIRPVDPLKRFTVEATSDGGYALVLMAAESRPAPKIRVNVDYRKVPGSVDEGAETIPYYGLSESSDDDLENALDLFLGKKKTLKRPDEIRFEQLSEEARQKKIPVKETDAERKKRLIGELNAQKAQKAKSPPSPTSPAASSPVTSSASSPSAKPSPDKTAPPCRKDLNPVPDGFKGIDADDSVGPRILAAGVRRKKEEEYGEPWRRFFDPFFDPHNYRRFLFVWGCGLIAVGMYLVLSRFLRAYSDPSSDFKPPFTAFLGLFYVQYIITLFPMAVWTVILLINGMTLYSETKDGFNRIRRWIPFRVEFASGYLFWLFLVAWIGTLPGSVLGSVFRLFRVVWAPFGFPVTGSVFLAGVSCFFLFPLFFLSVDANNRGIDLYHKKVWASLFRHFSAWGTYYFFSLILAAVQIGVLVGAGLFYHYSTRHDSFWTLFPAYFAVGALFCALTNLVIHLGFRLLGCLAYSVLEKS